MKAYCNGPVFTGEKWLKGVCILVENNKVVEIVAENNLPSDAEKLICKAICLLPRLLICKFTRLFFLGSNKVATELAP